VSRSLTAIRLQPANAVVGRASESLSIALLAFQIGRWSRAEIWLAPQISPRQGFRDELGESGSGSRAHVGAGPINVVLIGRTREVRARAILGLTATIAVKVVQASPPRVVRAPFLYSIGSVDNSYTPADRQPAAGPTALRAGKQGWSMGNPDNSTDISGSDPARRTALAEATNALEAPWLKPSSARRLAKMPTDPMSRLPLDLRPWARRTARQRRCSRLEASAS
jgi:hypothetical protein